MLLRREILQRSGRRMSPLWLGFDMDHTLVRYKLRELVSLVNRALRAALVSRGCEMGSDAEKFPIDIGKGAVCDAESGHVIFPLKTMQPPILGWHGASMLPRERLKMDYPDGVLGFEGRSADRWLVITSAFEYPLVSAWRQLVEDVDSKEEAPSDRREGYYR